MAYTDSEDLNYLGMMFQTAQRSTGLLNALGNPISATGGLNSSSWRTSNSFEFAVAQPYDSGAGTQPAITEAASVSGVTATTITRGQDVNTCQIFMEKAEVSYKKLSTTGTVNNALSGVHNVDGVQAGIGFGIGGNPVTNELDWQTQMRMKKMASDLDYSIIRGAYQGAASAATAAKTRGLTNAITTNSVNAGGVAISTTLVNSVLKSMVDSGAILNNITAWCNSANLQKLGALYENVPVSRTEGGAAITRIMTPYGDFNVGYDPNIITTEIMFVEMSILRIVVCPVDGRVMIVEDKSTDGASYARQLYLQAGLDYGAEEYHGKITNLAV